MKTLTLYQPLATLAAKRHKRFETRLWKTNYRGPLAIHSAKRRPEVIDNKYFHAAMGESYVLPLGAVIATCRLRDCIEITEEFVRGLSEKERAFGDFTVGRFAFELVDVTELARPMPTVGHQRLWNWSVPADRYESVQGPTSAPTSMRDFLGVKDATEQYNLATRIHFSMHDLGVKVAGDMIFDRISTSPVGNKEAYCVTYKQIGVIYLVGCGLSLHLDLLGRRWIGTEEATFFDGKLRITVKERG